MSAVAPGSAPEPAHRSFRGADLRGVRFDGAFLRGADFSGARTGMRPFWKLVNTGSGLGASIALGAVTGLGARYLLSAIESGDPRREALALNASAALLVYLVAAFWKGGEFASRTVLPVVTALMIAGGLIAIVTGVGTGVGAFVVLVFVLLGVAVLALASLARAVAGTATAAMFFVVAISGGLAGGLVGGGIPALVLALAAAFIGRRAMRRTQHYRRLSRVTVEIACRGGTSFRGADLSGADFSDAELIGSDFRGADLTGARWDRAEFKMCLFDGDRDTPPP